LSAKDAKKANQGMSFLLRTLRVLRTICFSRVPTERSEGIGRAAAAAAKQLNPESRAYALTPMSDPRLTALDPTYEIALV
jgi:hypothetical protein